MSKHTIGGKEQLSVINTGEQRKAFSNTEPSVMLEVENVSALKSFAAERRPGNVETRMAVSEPKVKENWRQERIYRLEDKIEDINDAELDTSYGESFVNAYKNTFKFVNLSLMMYAGINILKTGLPAYLGTIGGSLAVMSASKFLVLLGATAAALWVAVPLTIATLWTVGRFIVNKLNKFRLQGDIEFEERKLKNAA